MSTHMKRLTAPRSWTLKRKVTSWVTKQAPGPHAADKSMPALVVLRDVLGICDTAREAKRIIGNRDVLIDGKPLRSYKFPVGFMDVISIPKMKANYRMLLTDKGKLTMQTISEGESSWKLCRIENKTTIKQGKIQLNLHDGRNVVLDKNAYKTGDVLKISLKDQAVIETYPLTEGALAMIVEGPRAGATETVLATVEATGSAEDVVKFVSESETVKRNVFVIGAKTAAIKLPEASII